MRQASNLRTDSPWRDRAAMQCGCGMRLRQCPAANQPGQRPRPKARHFARQEIRPCD
ncbi:uncharacterized protein BCN122_I1661 [Burkholderia cenocepacia]|nr:uncharacterized protein BCN122_I1661 [Burkholderia cenocepacia]